MSWRVGLDVPKESWFEFSLEDTNSDCAKLAEQTAWLLPQKVFYTHWRVLLRYCRALARGHSMYPSEFWSIHKRQANGTYTVRWRK